MPCYELPHPLQSHHYPYRTVTSIAGLLRTPSTELPHSLEIRHTPWRSVTHCIKLPHFQHRDHIPYRVATPLTGLPHPLESCHTLLHPLQSSYRAIQSHHTLLESCCTHWRALVLSPDPHLIAIMFRGIIFIGKGTRGGMGPLLPSLFRLWGAQGAP